METTIILKAIYATALATLLETLVIIAAFFVAVWLEKVFDERKRG